MKITIFQNFLQRGMLPDCPKSPPELRYPRGCPLGFILPPKLILQPLRPQAAPDVCIGGGQRRRAPKIRSKLGGSGGMPLGNFFFDNTKCCKLGHFYHFCQALAPLGAACATVGPRSQFKKHTVGGLMVYSKFGH